jgi:hypothetical protein
MELKDIAPIIGIGLSIISLFISLWTLWLTRLKKGEVKLTKPNVVFFGPDGQSPKLKKIFIRTLMFSTSEKGNYIESMYANVFQNGKSQTFNIWVYGDKDLLRGSGLYVDKKGIASNHHFLLPANELSYEYSHGKYKIEIFVQTINGKPKKVLDLELVVTEEQSNIMKEKNLGLYFDWDTTSQKYYAHVRGKSEDLEFLQSLLAMNDKK